MPRPVLLNVQLLRFLAATSILFTHSAGLVFPNRGWIVDAPWVGGVDVFFIISGFIMTWMMNDHFGSRGAARTFLLRRLIRIVPPYWFFTFVTAAVVVGTAGLVANISATPMTLLTSLFFVPWPRPDGQLLPLVAQGWTLNYEIFFYLAFAAALLWRRGLLVLAGGFVAMAAAHAIVPDGWFVARYFTDPIILEFVAGIVVGQLYLRDVRLGGVGAMAAVGAAVVTYLCMRSSGLPFDRSIQLGIPAALLGGGLILGPALRARSLFSGIVKAAGDASYSLYLSHKLVVGAVILCCRQAGFQNPVFITAAAMATAIAASMVFYRWIEAPAVAAIARRSGAAFSAGPATVAP